MRIVTPAELNIEAGLDEEGQATAQADSDAPANALGLPDGHDLTHADGGVLAKDNRLTIDDATRQALSQAEIEELKKSSGGKEIIEKILANHAGLDEKTAFSKAKYMLRKHKKYMKRFTVLPVDLGYLIEHLLEKEPARIMELREETLGLITAWSNAHYSGLDGVEAEQGTHNSGRGRWLAVDDTGGLVVAALAERMDLLHPPLSEDNTGDQWRVDAQNGTDATDEQPSRNEDTTTDGVEKPIKVHRDFPLPANENSITVLHAAVQPNVSLLKYFGYDTSNPNLGAQVPEHPLHRGLKPLSWLQLLHPEEDPTYQEPDPVSDADLSTWKSGKRGTYFKKRRRWERCRAIVDDARSGGFEGLVVATHMELPTILQHTIPLIRGGGYIVIYSPTVEPLTVLMDLYSKERRAAYIGHLAKGEVPDPADFPLDPRLLLAPHLQTSRVRESQVLPGRTHPLMTSRGGAEGFLFTARRVIPLEGGVEARGNFYANKKRKVGLAEDAQSDPSPGIEQS